MSSASDSGRSTKSVSASRVIDASPEVIFRVLADPTMHHVIDGSGTVRDAVGDPRSLHLGDKFSTNMRMFIPYRMRNTVVEYDENRLIAWSHIGGWRWRYELAPVDLTDDANETDSKTDVEPSSARTRVTETFDWSTSPAGFYVTAVGWPERNRQGMEKTLARLDAFISSTSGGL